MTAVLPVVVESAHAASLHSACHRLHLGAKGCQQTEGNCFQEVMVKYELVTDRIPYDDMFYSQNELLVPEMEETVAKLHETIYGKVMTGEEETN